MKIQIVGADGLACKLVEDNVFCACNELELPAEITHIYRIKEAETLGVRRMPAVLIDGVPVFSGRIPTIEEMKEILKKKAAGAPKKAPVDLFAPTGTVGK